MGVMSGTLVTGRVLLMQARTGWLGTMKADGTLADIGMARTDGSNTTIIGTRIIAIGIMTGGTTITIITKMALKS